MCSVTFWPGDSGYICGMNRDERRDREVGLPPSMEWVGGRQSIYPREPGGGTWIALNDAGVTLALINWYAVLKRAKTPAESRGGIILSTRGADCPEEVAASVESMPLDRINPFRLIGFFPSRRLVKEWRWNQSKLTELEFDWSPRQWLSSGFDEPGAQKTRSEAFHLFKEDPSAGEISWFRQLHRSHAPSPGPYSTCMHRSDAATVSYTEIEWSSDQGGEMRHALGSPCCANSFDVTRLDPGMALEARLNKKSGRLFNRPDNQSFGCEDYFLKR